MTRAKSFTPAFIAAGAAALALSFGALGFAAVASAQTPAKPAAGAVALAITGAGGAKMSGNPAKGQAVFKQCATCHSLKAGENKVGPSLSKIIGRKSGTVAGFRYSKANQSAGITWTEQELFTYLENPRKRVPGTIMSFAGLRDAQQRADLIAFLRLNAK